ncbi:hypothetical protein GOP47_0018449 [Adiantum capillus-veneris]|uniref:RING-type E3 ubiquitin transferase n=1 Tax=Adiantum capillus-veneris TaxID=13818 RepID=A0A9D4UDE9_ADICA|nr:hypothetical protein GOP47_0018449 [Adiantum capillus-veneris]
MSCTVCRGHSRQLNESLREAQINPSIVVIIIILTIIFFLSGCLHLLIRCLVMRSPRRDSNSIVTLTALQGQLQQLFHLHDSGVEQAFIDTLPVFFYKSVTGLKEGADCAVCLCEFEGEDRLRLLPKCSHAFHMDCIDTWLLSHSTCPLCRRSLLPDLDLGIAAAHQGLLLDSGRSSIDAEALQRTGSELRPETVSTAESASERLGATSPSAGNKPHSEVVMELGGASVSFPEGHPQSQYAGKVFALQLGRFRVVEGGAHAGVSSSITGSRRSYSVGSYEYVLDPSSSEVVIAPTPLRKRTTTPRRPTPGHRATLSECAQEDTVPDLMATPLGQYGFVRVANFSLNFDLTSPDQCSACVPHGAAKDIELSAASAGVGAGAVSQSNAGSTSTSTRRAFSFRQPVSQEAVKVKLMVSASRRSLSEADQVYFQQGMGSASGVDTGAWGDDLRSFSGAQLVTASTELSNSIPGAHMPSSLRGAAIAPYSLAKRTLNWLIGRQHRWTSTSHDSSLPV